MINYDKSEIKAELTLDNIFELLQEWGGDPEYSSNGIIATTICHNEPGVGSRKLYFYENSSLFKCYTGCENDVFDIFELCIKVMDIQNHLEWDLNDAIRYIANRFGIAGSALDLEEGKVLEDWNVFNKYDQIQKIKINDYKFLYKEYDDIILSRFNYNLLIKPWLDDNISQEAIDLAKIGFYPGGDQITIPHYDINNRFIGLRGRCLCEEEAERYGKYRPLKINNILYSHPLGMNLYGLNWAKDNIKRVKKAIIFESEKAVLQYISYFGIENDIAVACCGSNISIHQIVQLLSCGAEEIIVAFDRQFKEMNDDECHKLTKLLTKINNKYSRYCLISFIFDKNLLLGYKDSPTDKNKEIFLQLFKERVIL